MKNINTWTNTNTQADNTKQQIPVQNSARHDVISPEPWTYKTTKTKDKLNKQKHCQEATWNLRNIIIGLKGLRNVKFGR